jgi:phosphoribosyl 1,2-cyclic phosphodiesterase
MPINKIQRASGFTLHQVEACLISHEHKDHSFAAQDLIRAGINVFCGPETASNLKLSGHRLKTFKNLKQFKVGSFNILPFQVPHDVPNYGFLICEGMEKWVFLIDCAYCPYTFIGLTGIILGINYDETMIKKNVLDGRLHPALCSRIIKNHFSLQAAIKFFRAQDLSKVREIHIVHCSEHNSDKNKMLVAVQKETGKLVEVH